MDLHEGHRARLKRRFLEHGLDSFDDVNILELLLFFAIPRRDTNPVAHRLLEHFGSLSAVLEASPAELGQVEGLGAGGKTLLALFPAVSRRYLLDKTPRDGPVDSPTAAGRYFLPQFSYARDELIYALLLDARHQPLACRELARGVVNAVEINVRRLAELVLEYRASSVVLAHNHLSGVATPSKEDALVTRRVQDALHLLGTELDDHVIVAGCEYVSLREAGFLLPDDG